MELNEKPSAFIKIVIVISGLIFIQCNNEIKKNNCDKINNKSAQLIHQYCLDSNNKYLDSALYYINQGIENCNNYKNVFLLKKLYILSEQQKFIQAIGFIETFEKPMFSDLPYYQELLINRFKVMAAINNHNVNDRDKYLELCVIIIDNYLSKNKEEVDSLLKQSNIENILQNHLSTAVTQYYYYKSLNDFKGVQNDLRKKKVENDINNEFIDYLMEYLKTDFMEFNGI